MIHANTKLARVQLTVCDLNRSVKFYEEIIGMKTRARKNGVAFLGAGKEDLLVLKENPDAKQTRGTSGLYHFAILVPSRLALAHSLQRLADTQTAVEGFADHLVSEAIYLPDPDGNGIEIYRDRPRDQWRDADGKLKMASDPIDLDGILAELQGQDQTWRGLDAATVLGHMHLHVAHIAPAQEFYVNVLGFDLVMRYGPSAAFVSAGGYHHHLGLNTWAGVGAPPPPRDAVGLDYWVVRVPDATELGKIADRVQNAGVKVEETDEGLLARDPSQNAVVIAAG
ncbi:MAG: VOC family protein [Chloroflexi bacterium]|nr:VOC family protein [Chloroflexota bacterium]